MGEFSFLIRAGEGLDTLMGVMWLDISIVCPKFVKDFDKALSKYCLFDLFSAIKHKRKEIRRNR
jgi:hypothetical protein